LIKKQKNKIAINHPFSTGILVLDNKLVFKGIGLGYQGTSTGEVCFNTSLTGYQEIISDPSYAGQIINFTFPHIGNVGTNNEDLESDKIWTKGVIFNSEITSPSNYRALQTLDKWLKKNQIVGLTGLDTRSLTNLIRDKGAPKGTITNNKKMKLNEEPSVRAAIDFVIEKVLMQAFLSKYVQENIKEENLKASYNNFIADETSREEIKASHILMDTESEAIDVINMLNDGDDFAELAKNKSTGPSGPSGGDLGWFKRGQMVPPFEKAAFSLNKNEISQRPVQTQFGWHVIKIFDKRIPEAPSYESMKSKLIQDLERKIVSKKIQDLRNDALIEKLSSSELEPLLNLPVSQ
jgi:hypothetical protein